MERSLYLGGGVAEQWLNGRSLVALVAGYLGAWSLFRGVSDCRFVLFCFFNDGSTNKPESQNGRGFILNVSPLSLKKCATFNLFALAIASFMPTRSTDCVPQ